MSDPIATLPVGAAPPAAPAPARAASYVNLQRGDRFPWLTQDVISKENFVLDTLAGRYQLYCFFLTAQDEPGRRAVEAVLKRPDLFNDMHCSFLGVSVNPADRKSGLADRPGARFICDYDLKVSKACGAAVAEAAPGDGVPLRRFWVLVDPSLHVLKTFSFDQDPHAVLDAVQALVPPDRFGGIERPAPILLLPNVLEPEMCRHLIGLYDQHGGGESGVQRNGKGVLDRSYKSRKDYTVEDPALLQQLRRRVVKRVVPEIEKLFFGQMTYIERFIVGCYSAEDGGHFAAHRDNREGLTAHRRYALSINLNDGFEGGEVIFPEYGSQGYKAPAGWAVVFPCAILHQVRRVTSGARYAFLPFLYDEEGAAIRKAALERAGAAG